jgi:hypothetical protein
VTQPRIAIFARLANGNVEPKRVIEGQATTLGRTLHGIAYHSARDEIIVGNPLAASVLVFRGGASGNEAPLRTIQGPKTTLVYPHALNVDVTNNEIIVLDPGTRSVLVFPLDADGDVAPIRIIRGEKTRLEHVVGAGVDAERNLLVVSSSGTRTGLYIFNRTDTGDVAPRAVISGPKAGIESIHWQLQVHQGKIYAAIADFFYHPLYSGIKPRAAPNTPVTSPWSSERVGFIGVWRTTDNGDVPPLAIIRGPGSGLIHASGVALNPKHREIFAVDSVRNGLFTFLVPEFFPSASSNQVR